MELEILGLVVLGIKIAVGLGIVWAIWNSFFGWWFMVDEMEVAILTMFRKYFGTRAAGLRFKIPLVWKVAGTVSLQLQELIVEVEAFTKDSVPVTVEISVQYRVTEEGAYLWYYNMDDPEGQIGSMIDKTVLGFCARTKLTDLLEQTDALSDAVEAELAGLMQTQAGAEIVRSFVKGVGVDDQVQAAMARVKASERDLAAAANQAAAMKATTIAAAEAEAESKRLQGEGIAALRLAVARGMKESLELTQEAGLGTDEAQRLMLVTLWADMLRDSANGSNSTVLMLPNGPDGLQSTMQQLMATMAANKPDGEEPTAAAA
ncbi:hypothetical protein KBD09_02970 [Candidatus Woesebacteria bacterium]|nr:hypothetical protein [Candidatus Woesebacteria bacterium]